MTNSEAGRKAFEEWYVTTNQPNIGLGQFGVTPHGTYAYQSVQAKYIGWQASRNQLLAILESPECVEVLRNALYVKHSQQSEDERIKHAISTIVKKLNGEK